MKDKEELKEIIKERCITYGDFTLQSGQKSNWKCDLLNARDYYEDMVVLLMPFIPLYGMELSGYLLAISWDKHSGLVRKTGEVYKHTKAIESDITLIDDVVTTEKSIKYANKLLNNVGLKVVDNICILDRRKKESILISSLFTSKDFGLD